jgi:hypothetical protein
MKKRADLASPFILLLHPSSFILHPWIQMLTNTPPPFQKRRKLPKASRKSAAPVALTLVSAEYAKNDWVRLTFNRPIDIAALDGTQIEVDDDAMSGNRYNGSLGGTLINATTVEIDLDRTGSATQSGVHLIASATSGIVAADDASEWSGVADLALPFP